MVPGKEYPVILILRNFGKENVTVYLEDSVSQEFSTGSDMSWMIGLPAGKTEIVSYNIRTSRPGVGLALPAAAASYQIGNKSYESRSEGLSIDVSGPYLEVEKRISPSSVHPGDAVRIFMDIKNRGNRTVKASINETVPAWAKLLGGKTQFNKIFNSSEEATHSYLISCKVPGNYKIPETKVLYSDARGDHYSINSSSLNLFVIEEESPLNMTGGEKSSAREDVSTVTNISDAPYNSMDLNDLNYFIESSSLWISFLLVSAIIYLLLGKIL